MIEFLFQNCSIYLPFPQRKRRDMQDNNNAQLEIPEKITQNSSLLVGSGVITYGMIMSLPLLLSIFIER